MIVILLNRFLSITGIMQKKITYPKTNIMDKNFKPEYVNSGVDGVLFKIFLNILPFLVENPVFMTRAIGSPLV